VDTSAVPARPPEYRPYRLAVYALVGALTAVFLFQLVRSVTADLFGRPLPGGAERPATAAACLDDVDRLWASLSARAVQPAPHGLQGEQLAREWSDWVVRWEDEVREVSKRCSLDEPADDVREQLAAALEHLENLRRALSASGAGASEEARKVKDALASARAALRAL
jgi:hypothetical protein